MGKDRDPWHLHTLNYGSNVGASAPTADPCELFRLNWTSIPPSQPAGRKRFMVFDHSKNQTNLIYNSVGYPTSSTLDLHASNEINVSNGNEEEMREDTEEIDALLYSNSDSYHEEEEEASTGHSPITMTIGNFDEEEDVAVLPPPAKKRRIGARSELDPSLTDTASSTNCEEVRKKSKREKIQDTVRVLRQILPESRGKDAASVLDEAIHYLRSLRLKAKVLGVASPTSI